MPEFCWKNGVNNLMSNDISEKRYVLKLVLNPENSV